MSDFYRTEWYDKTTGVIGTGCHWISKGTSYAFNEAINFTPVGIGVIVGTCAVGVYYAANKGFNIKNMFWGVAKPAGTVAALAAAAVGISVLVDAGTNARHEINNGTDGDVIEMKVPAQFHRAP